MAWQIDSDDFKARLVVSQSRAYLGEEVSLSLELATPQWFTQAADIHLPGQSDVMWLQRQVFADNSREQIDGKMWTVQRWPLAVFPRRVGQLLLLPVVIKVGVADSLGRSQTKKVSLGGLSLMGIPLDGFSLVANDYRVDVSVAGQPITPGRPLTLAPGEAIELAYHSQAENTLAMFLPNIVPTLQTPDHVTLYPQLAELKNDNERGRRTAHRIDRYTLVAQKTVSLYATVEPVSWFDKQGGKRDRIAIAAVGLAPEHSNPMASQRDLPYLIWLALALVIAAVYVVAGDAKRAMTPLHRQRYTCQQACLRAARQGDWQVFSSQLYALYDSYPAYRGQPIRVTIAQRCDADTVQRLNEMLDTAYAGAVTLVDGNDQQHLKHFFNRLSVNPPPAITEPHDASFLL